MKKKYIAPDAELFSLALLDIIGLSQGDLNSEDADVNYEDLFA